MTPDAVHRVINEAEISTPTGLVRCPSSRRAPSRYLQAEFVQPHRKSRADKLQFCVRSRAPSQPPVEAGKKSGWKNRRMLWRWRTHHAETHARTPTVTSA